MVVQGRKLLVIGTTSHETRLRYHQLGVMECFDFVQRVPLLHTEETIANLLQKSGKIEGTEPEIAVAAQQISLACPEGVDIRRLLKGLDLMARKSGKVSARDFGESFSEALSQQLRASRVAEYNE